MRSLPVDNKVFKMKILIQALAGLLVLVHSDVTSVFYESIKSC